MAVLFIASPTSPASADDARDAQYFREQVEPLLARHCLRCHSHAAGKMEGGLTLDSRSGWVQGGDRGVAVAPGKPASSLLMRAITYNDAELQMPPDKKLPDAAIKVLEDWIRGGAHDPRESAATGRSDPMDWWSLRPLPEKVAVPPMDSHGSAAFALATNPIDAFVQHRLHSEGLTPSPSADRRVLIRRLFHDLHGLPPTPEEVKSFVHDRSPRAYARLVDRLLASPRYGERWARHWLDTIHFADSHGCEHDVYRPNAWRYRDYVIDSLNRDTPWPRFLREQLAADWFYPNETGLTAALGFIAAGPLELSRAGTAPVTFDYLDRDDIVTQTMAAFASSTANCARCHDHKFDPISQEDYYSLQAVFAGVGKGAIEYDDDPRVNAARQRWHAMLAAVAGDDRQSLLSEANAKIVADWEAEHDTAPPAWTTLTPNQSIASNGSTLTLLDDGSIYAEGECPETDTYTITSPVGLAKLSAIQLHVLSDDRLPKQGPGRQANGNLHLSEFEAYLIEPQIEGAKTATPVRLELRKATADWDQSGWTIAHSLDGNEQTAWGIYPQVGQSHHAVFELANPRPIAPGSQLQCVLKQLHGQSHLIGRLRLDVTDATDLTANTLPADVAAALQHADDTKPRNEQQRAVIARHVLKQHAETELAKLPKPAMVYGVSTFYSHAKKLDQPMAPKTVHVLRRGNIDQPGKVALPGAISSISALPGRFSLPTEGGENNEAARRAALADWLAAKENPLTYRSAVNRVWTHHFGRGLCDTPNDFGRMGGEPTHPELLDWLAVWFRDDAAGSVKQLHRLILLSHTYRQSSATTAANSAKDAENRLLWRLPRRRLDAGSYRDSVRKITDRLDLTMGGAAIQHFTQAPGAQVTPQLDYTAYDWSQPNAARRSIYRAVWRGMSDPFMEALDFPDLALLAPNRSTSVSALQALTMYNNDFVLHHSQSLAQSLQSQHSTQVDQVTEAVRRIYLRPPNDNERASLVRYVNQHGLAAACRVLFNSNEFLFIP